MLALALYRRSQREPHHQQRHRPQCKGWHWLKCEKHSKKEEALTKLKAGGKFDEIAREFSEDKPRVGGLLGWKKRGELDLAFETAAFDLETSTTASPKYIEVKTGFGYHIIMVEGRKWIAVLGFAMNKNGFEHSDGVRRLKI
jgi:hypothetical protein